MVAMPPSTSPTVINAPMYRITDSTGANVDWTLRIKLSDEPNVIKVEPKPEPPRYLNRQERRALAAKQRRRR